MTALQSIMRLALVGIVTACLSAAAPASAHPAPFSYLDVRVQDSGLDVTLVVHAFDVAHDLGVTPPDRLFDPAVLAQHGEAMTRLLKGRLRIAADGRMLGDGTWSTPEPLAERRSFRLRGRYDTTGPAGAVDISAAVFPYDAAHQTFVNFYEGDALTSQEILDGGRTRFEYFAGSPQGVLAVLRRFLPSGVRHILIGPDHLLFLVGLLLLGGTIRQLALVVTAFTAAHSITLSLAALNLINPPARIIEPVIALSIVYVGADNLMVRGGRDLRAWIAFGFGLVHGFGFANVLRGMELPARALGWSLFSFNLGVEIGQLLVVVAVASALAALRSRSEPAARRLALAGSVVVIAAGTFWFVQRVFFPGGLA